MERSEEEKKKKRENKQNPGQVSLGKLISNLKEGAYAIPGFQREFEWVPKHINELMRSIFSDYYIGNLLLWEENPRNFDALTCDPLYGALKIQHPALIVLDGQQRLSAMHYAFFEPKIPLPKRKRYPLFFINVDCFMKEVYEDAFRYDSRAQTWKLFEDKDRQFEDHMFPLAIIGRGASSISEWIQDYEDYWRKREQEAKTANYIDASQTAYRYAENARGFRKRLLEILDHYKIVYVVLKPKIELGKVCETFTKINSQGVKLNIFDLMNALLKPKNLELKKMWRAQQSRFKFVETEKKVNVYILQVMSILQQNYCSPKHLYNLIPGRERKVREMGAPLSKDTLVNNEEEFEQLWQQAVNELCDTIGRLRDPREFGAISSRYIPYVSILPAFAAIQANAKKLSTNQLISAQHKIKQWYWVSVFANRYSRSVESISTRDFQDLDAWFKNDAAKPAWITEFEARPYPYGIEARGAKPTGSIYKGIFNLLVLRGADDWITGRPPQEGTLDNHHIVPKSWGKKHRLGSLIDTILNRTPLSSDTNRKVIGDRLPNEYLPELIKGNGEKTVRKIFESHLISSDAFDILMEKRFTSDHYEDFIKERERTVLEAIKNKVLE